MEDCKPVSTHLVTSCKLNKDDEYRELDQRIYRLMIEKLLYVTTLRPYVMQVVGEVSIFQVALKETHVMDVKRIFQYLKGKIEFGMWYPKGNEMTMVIYIDVDWVGSIDDRRSANGETFYLGDFLVS
jgi:hypothetical protein